MGLAQMAGPLQAAPARRPEARRRDRRLRQAALVRRHPRARGRFPENASDPFLKKASCGSRRRRSTRGRSAVTSRSRIGVRGASQPRTGAKVLEQAAAYARPSASSAPFSASSIVMSNLTDIAAVGVGIAGVRRDDLRVVAFANLITALWWRASARYRRDRRRASADGAHDVSSRSRVSTRSWSATPRTVPR